MKRLIFAALALALCLAPAFAALKACAYPEISLEVSSQLNVNKWNFTDEFPTHGCCYIKNNAVAVLVLTKDKLPDLPSMQAAMVKLSGVMLNYWQLAGEGKRDAQGWDWRKEYAVTICGKSVYTVLGHSGRNAYLVMLCADQMGAPRLRVSSVRGNPR